MEATNRIARKGKRYQPSVPTEQLKALYQLRSARSILAVVMDFALIALTIAMCEYISYWLYPIAFVIAGSRFHALEGMLHEASHYRLHSSKAVNDFLGELISWPFGHSLITYRKILHRGHHSNLGTAFDTHILFLYKPKLIYESNKSIKFLLINSFYIGVNFLKSVIHNYKNTLKLLPRLSPYRFRWWLVFQGSLLAFLILGSIFWTYKVAVIYILFLLVPHVWVLVFSGYLRLLFEHFHIPGSPEDTPLGGDTRTVIVSWPLRVLIWPHNLNYHQEHHWYPAVPFYNLPKLHALLYEQEEVRPKMNVTFGIKNLLQEITA